MVSASILVDVVALQIESGVEPMDNVGSVL